MYYMTVRVFPQSKELLRRRDHNLLGLRYGAFKCGVQDSGKVDMSSQGQLGVAVTVQDMYRTSCVETVL